MVIKDVFLAVSIFLVGLVIIAASIQHDQLIKENEKFKAEIEYLVEQNEILIEENASLYDMYWIESNGEMKEENQ